MIANGDPAFALGSPIVDILARSAIPFDPRNRVSLRRVLAPILAGADIVMLGEPMHGDGGAIALRALLVEVLYADFGFDVLVFEADFFSIAEGWKAVRRGADVHTFAEANIYDFWSRAPAARGLWKFVGERAQSSARFDVAGIDCRFRGTIAKQSLLAELRNALEPTGLYAAPEFNTFEMGVRKLFDDEYGFKPDKKFEAEWFAFCRRAVDALQSDGASINSFAVATFASLARWAGFAWLGESRDRAMGLNLAWLRDHRFVGRKKIVWAHNNHILKSARVLTASTDPKLRSAETPGEKAQHVHLGQVAAQRWGDTVRSIALIDGVGAVSSDYPSALSGARMNFEPVRSVPSHSLDSLEAILLNSSATTSIVDLRSVDPEAEFRSRAIDLDFEAMAPYALGYDALIFNRETHGLGS